MSEFRDSFVDESFFSNKNSDFSLEDGPSLKTDDEIRMMWEGNLNSIRTNTRVANSLFDNSSVDTNQLERDSIKKFVTELILKKNVRGSKLKETINYYFNDKVLSTHKDLITSLIEHEWLIGNVFEDLSSYESCLPLKKFIRKSKSNQIVKCGECKQCPYNIKSSCTFYNKTLLDSTSQVDYKSFAKRNNLRGSDKKEISNFIRNAAEYKDIVPLVKKSNHATWESGNSKVSSQYNFDNAIKNNQSITEMTWDDIKKAFPNVVARKLLKHFVRKNIKEGSLDFKRMFGSSDIEDIRKYRSYLKKVAAEYSQDSSILDQVEDFFDYRHQNKRLYLSTQDEYQWYNQRYEVAKQAGVEEDIRSLTWEQAKKQFPKVNKTKLLDLFVERKVTAYDCSLEKMFEGSSQSEINTLVSRRSLKKLSSLEGYDSFFKTQTAEQFLSPSQKQANLSPCDSLNNIETSSQTDLLRDLSCSSNLTNEEVQTKFIELVKARNVHNTISFLKNNNIRSKTILSLVAMVRKISSKYNNDCNVILENLGLNQDVIKKIESIKKVANKDTKVSLFDSVFYGTEGGDCLKVQEDEEPISFDDFKTSGISFK